MKFIRKQVDELKKPFLKGGKLEILYPAFNAFETMLFVPDHTTSKGCLLYTSPSPRDRQKSRMPSSA